MKKLVKMYWFFPNNVNYRNIAKSCWLVKVYSAAIHGVNATVITIEINCSRGIKFFSDWFARC